MNCLNLIRKILKKIKEHTGEKRLSTFPKQRLSVKIATRNAASSLSSLSREPKFIFIVYSVIINCFLPTIELICINKSRTSETGFPKAWVEMVDKCMKTFK